ncbi:DNA-binding protein [Peribacillus sp. SCS-155]|uniref:DNA-binding protein n=1 Tax=Peribacillus sedimenti TaxID=3115297 RepID=UPI003906C8A0
MDISFFWIAVGLAAFGYFIGDGLKNFKNPKGSPSVYPTLIKESQLPMYLNLSREEVTDLLRKYPDAPKIELNGTAYYPYQRFLEWFSSEDFYRK